jgi:hypothetical protein
VAATHAQPPVRVGDMDIYMRPKWQHGALVRLTEVGTAETRGCVRYNSLCTGWVEVSGPAGCFIIPRAEVQVCWLSHGRVRNGLAAP